MPEWAVREMVADWLGASRAYEGRWPDGTQAWPWMVQNLGKIKERMHPKTCKMVDQVLSEAFTYGEG